MPPSQHVGTSCLCLSGAAGARLSPALTVRSTTRSLAAAAAAGSRGAGPRGLGCPLFYIYFKKKSPEGVKHSVAGAQPAVLPEVSAVPAPRPRVAFPLLLRAIPSGVRAGVCGAQALSPTSARSDPTPAAKQTGGRACPHRVSHTERSCCKETKRNKKSQKSLYKDLFLYYMGTLPACQQ